MARSRPPSSRPPRSPKPAKSRRPPTASGHRPLQSGTGVVTPPRKTAMWTAAAVVLVAAVAAGLWWWRRPAPAGPYILISIDTTRADHLPLYGYTHGSTPNIDAFAKGAIVYDHAYSHAPQTLPEHTVMLTGLLPFQSGVRDNIGFVLKPGTPTLASLFHQAGYATGGFVSAYVLQPGTGVGQGFDVYDANMPAGSPERPLAQVERPGLDTLAAADRWMNTLGSDRFFLFFHIYEPHKPYQPPARYASLAPYDGEIAFADEIVGRLFGDLKQRGWFDPATIVLTADHGEGLGDHGEDEHGLFLYNSTTHIPLVIKLPGQRDGGRRVAEPVGHFDILPTLAHLAGWRPPADARGRDLSPTFGGGTIPVEGIYAEAVFGLYHFGWSQLQSLTDDRFRFIKAPKPELYDLARDPNEQDNIVNQRVPVAQGMQAGLENIVAGHGFEAPQSVSAATRERLAALGYVGSSPAATLNGPASSLPDPKDKVALLNAFKQAADDIGGTNFAKAADELHAIVDEDPGMVDAWKQLAAVRVRLGRLDAALEAYKHIIELSPNEVGPVLDTATVLLKLKRYKEAQAHAEAAAARDPVNGHQLLAKIALEEGDDETALKEAALAEQADPTLPLTAFVQGMIAYNAHEYAKALPLLMDARNRFAGRTMQIADLRYYIGDCLARLNRPQDARPFFQEELSIFPGSIHAHEGLALLDATAGDLDAAGRVIDDLLARAPTPDAYQSGAQLWRMFGQPDKAEALRAEAQKRFGGQ